MTMILQESEQISPDLLRPLLDSVGNENRVTYFSLYLFLVFFSFSLFYSYGNLISCLFFFFLCNLVNLVLFIFPDCFTYVLDIGGESNQKLYC